MSGKSRRRRAARARKAARNKDRAGATILARVSERSSPTRGPVPMLALACVAVLLAISTLAAPILVVVLLGLLWWMGARFVVSQSAPAREPRNSGDTDKMVRATPKGLWLADEIIPRSDIRKAYATEHDARGRQTVVVERRRGPTLELRLPRGVDAAKLIDALVLEVPSRAPLTPIPAPEHAPEHAPDPLPDTTPLRRRDRPLDAWMASLHAIGSGDNAGLRTAPIPRERLIRILTEPTADTADRAAAAVALAHGMNESERAELRVSARDAERRLRVVLDHVASEAEDEVLAEALEEATGDR